MTELLPNIGSRLLYSAASALERAMLDAETERVFAIPAEKVNEVWDPYKIDYVNLPFLAWGMGVNLWEDWWSEEFKRWWVAKAWETLALRGTPDGIRRYVTNGMGIPIQRFVRPPQTAFPGKSETKAERDAWLGLMPQLRLYRFRTHGNGHGRLFCNRCFLGRSDKTGWSYRAFPRLSTAQERWGTRAFLWDHADPEIPLRTVTVSSHEANGTATDVYRIVNAGDGRGGFFLGQFLKAHGSFLGKPVKHGSIYTINVDSTYDYHVDSLHFGAVSPSLDPVDTKFLYVQQHGTAQYGSVFPNTRNDLAKKRTGKNKQFLNHCYLPKTTAPMRLFQRLFLFDPTRGIALRGARAFLGNIRLGMEPYSAEVHAVIINKRPRKAINGFLRGFLHKTPQTKLLRTAKAIRASKSLTDTVLIRTGLYKPAIMDGPGIPLDGSYRFGDRSIRS